MDDPERQEPNDWPEETHMAESEQFERGLEIRRQVLGTDYVDANLAGTDEFMMGFQRLLTEWAWGYAWSRPGLDRKTRSMLNLAILTALGRPQELGIYVKGALRYHLKLWIGDGCEGAAYLPS
jgi:hypothetical protein